MRIFARIVLPADRHGHHLDSAGREHPPGSFMTGDIRWAWRGSGAVAAGILLLVFVIRKRR